jgi:hypothetical protein
MSDIRTSQNSDRNLRRQQAKDHYYTIGNRWHFGGAGVAILLALASPFVLLYRPNWGPTLGAAAGIWIFASRLFFEPLNKKHRVCGASAQELFDCDVLGLDWNESLVNRLSDEEIHRSGMGFEKPKAKKKHSNWYPADVEMAWPRSVIACQRSNAVWARRQHRAYSSSLFVAAAAWFVFGVILSLVHKASLSDYLTTILLPSLPAVLDSTDLAQQHRAASARRQEIENQTDAMFADEAIGDAEIRELQDQVFEMRRSDPPVAGWFYWLISKRYEQDMKFAAEQRADPPGVHGA